ncbi:hypothetical protein PENANT_c010G02607 [Penicillium antarcticum]|uniref:Tyrosine specific protein phosphatases domain-containing protein n=1 Tax=Penicillium antarcticum TaxID=416450 RepID=A0A1V6Q8V8_9EURO|nr:uncharacterized protein N7508_000628 [Penicillium antarcticum]KAJ5320345.1 hypothetical protein N7508_000628 [Penicillium antarcticum]OQD85226.1 hypothetical protein PENANT_c010G02607 [Penicillium antarcticum]
MSVPRANNDFGQVVHGVYRSGFPDLEHHHQNLRGIRTIIKLTDKGYEQAEARYFFDHRVRILQPPMPRDHPRPDNLWPHRTLEKERVTNDEVDRILTSIIDTKNHPILIHGDNGKHATGAIVGCFRRIQGWDPADIIQEYRRYAGANARHIDESFFCIYQPSQRILALASCTNVTAWGSSRASSPNWASFLLSEANESRETLLSHQSHQGNRSLQGSESHRDDQSVQDSQGHRRNQSHQSGRTYQGNQSHRENQSHQDNQSHQGQQIPQNGPGSQGHRRKQSHQSNQIYQGNQSHQGRSERCG